MYLVFPVIVIVLLYAYPVALDRTRRLERIYNPIMAMGFSAMFSFQLDNTKR